MSEDVAERLAREHPQREYDIVRDQYAHSFSPIELSRASFLTAVNSLPRGSGTGPSAWQYEHLKILAECESTEESLFSVFSMIAKGRISSGASSTLLSASHVISILKSNRDVRPIAVGESLRRLTAKLSVFRNNLLLSFSLLYNMELQSRVDQNCSSITYSCYWTRILTV